MVTRAEIIAEGRSWARTPFRWQQSVKGRGCDCKGLMVGIARELGMPEATTMDAQVADYSRLFRGERLLEGLARTLIRVPVGRAQPGDILALPMGKSPLPRHLVLLTRPGFILHSMGGGVGFVAEVPLGRDDRPHSVWTWPSLGEGHG